jgi:glycosyltransferase involved in cell wall biosynthesis
MKKKILIPLCVAFVAILSFSLWKSGSKRHQKAVVAALPEKPFVIIIPSYNNTLYCEHNVISVLNQNYKNFRVIYIDDCSKDDTYAKVAALIERSPMKDRITLIHNEANKGALRNIYEAVHSCDDQAIVVTVDGDDFLAHDDVLKKLNKVYSSGDVWMTYGNYLDYPSYHQKPEICRAFPKSVVRNNSFRKHEWVASHLRTFYAGLFKKIAKEDFLLDGKFLPMGWDLAFMIPMLEMAGEHHRFIEEPLYLYNRTNPINDHKVNLALQSACHGHILNHPPYERLNSAPY